MTQAISAFDHMSNGQLRTNGIEDMRLLNAMRAVAREHFVPASLAGSAYVDEDLPLGQGRFLLEPLVLANLLERARIGTDDKALVIGGGFGYSAAVLAHLVAQVVLLESSADFVSEARRRLIGAGTAALSVEQGPLEAGCTALAPYDIILIEGAVEMVPHGLQTQLRDGGRLVTLEQLSPRPGDNSGLCRYLTIERHGAVFVQRYDGTAFVHALAEFARPKPFVL